MIQSGHRPDDSLALTRVGKEERVRRGDVVVTAGWPQGDFGSIYPRNIRIGTVTSAELTDVDVHQRIQVRPFADFSKVRVVLVLKNKKRPTGRR